MAGTAKEAQRQDYGDEYREMAHTETDWLDRLAKLNGERGANRSGDRRAGRGGYPSEGDVSASASVVAGKRKREKLTEP